MNLPKEGQPPNVNNVQVSKPGGAMLGGKSQLGRSGLRVMLIRPVVNRYGASKMMTELGSGLRRAGHTVICVSDNSGDVAVEWTKLGVEHFSAPLRQDRKSPLTFLKCLVTIVHIARKHQIDLIHSHHRWSSFVAYSAAKWLGIPLVTTCHEVHRNRQMLSVWGNKIICVSQDAAHHLQREFHVAPERIRVIHNGISMPDTSADRGVGSVASGVTLSDPLWVTSVGRLSPEKNQESLLSLSLIHI